MLEVRSLSKSYGDNKVLNGISFDVPEGQFVCLLGPSGCGKTTLLRIASGLVRADVGEICVGGRTVTGPGQDLSIVFQNYGLLPWRTVLGNVELGLEIRGVDRIEG